MFNITIKMVYKYDKVMKIITVHKISLTFVVVVVGL